MKDKSRLPRKVFVTPYTKWFIERLGTKCSYGIELINDIQDSVNHIREKDGSILATGKTFILYITDPIKPGEPERVLVWHGPSDGGLSLRKSAEEQLIHWDVAFT